MKNFFNTLRARFSARWSKPLSLTKFSLILSVATLLLYHYPLFKYIVENIESGFNGILIFITMIVVMLAMFMMM